MPNSPTSSHYATPEFNPVGAEDDITFIRRRWYAAAVYGRNDVLNECDDFPNNLTPKWNTILHVAAQFGQAECVTWILLRCLPLLQQPNVEGDTPLHLAAREGHLAVVRALIRQAGDPERGNVAELLGMTNRALNTALHEAVINHDPEVVEFLINHNPLYGYVANAEGKTPLYIATEQGSGDLVNMIINNCRSPAYSGINGRTALHAAVFLNDLAMTKKILQWRPDLREELDEKGWSPLHLAAYVGCRPKIVRQLVEKSNPRVVYLGLRNHGNRTALHIAAGRGHVGIVKELVRCFPDCCEQVDDDGNNVLHLIIQKNVFLSWGLLNIRWLGLKGLRNQKNVKGETPLHLFHASSSLPEQMIWFIVSLIGSLGKENNWSLLSSRVAVTSSEIKEDSERSKSKESEISRIQKIMETQMVAAALIATVTFTAGFNPPGGFVQSGSEKEGRAVLSSLPGNGNTTQHSIFGLLLSYKPGQLFKYFMVADGLALVLAVCAIGVYFYASISKREKHIMEFYLHYGTFLTVAAIAAMTTAFVSGVEAATELGIVTFVFRATFYILLCVAYLGHMGLLKFLSSVRAQYYSSKVPRIIIFALFLLMFSTGIYLIVVGPLAWGTALVFPMLLLSFWMLEQLKRRLPVKP